MQLPGALLYNADLTGAKLAGYITLDSGTKFFAYENGSDNAAICPDGRRSSAVINCGIKLN